MEGCFKVAGSPKPKTQAKYKLNETNGRAGAVSLNGSKITWPVIEVWMT